MTKLRYTGVGSRETPEDVLALQFRIGATLAKHGAELFSGHADGSDLAFETGAVSEGGSCKIFLPWKGFNGSKSLLYAPAKPRAIEIAQAAHPAWRFLSPGMQKMHARNVCQVLDESLEEPTDVCICWTPDGAEMAKETSKASGGTGTAIRLASMHGVPVFNLQRLASRYGLERWLSQRGIEIELGGHPDPVQASLL